MGLAIPIFCWPLLRLCVDNWHTHQGCRTAPTPRSTMHIFHMVASTHNHNICWHTTSTTTIHNIPQSPNKTNIPERHGTCCGRGDEDHLHHHNNLHYFYYLPLPMTTTIPSTNTFNTNLQTMLPPSDQPCLPTSGNVATEQPTCCQRATNNTPQLATVQATNNHTTQKLRHTWSLSPGWHMQSS